MAFVATTKRMVVQYGKRDGSPRVEYWFMSEDDLIKTVSPAQWKKSTLPDVSSDHDKENTSFLLLKELLKKSNLGDVVRLNTIFKSQGITSPIEQFQIAQKFLPKG